LEKIYTYEAFGLTISSEIECKELLLGKGNSDVVITLEPSPNRYKVELKHKRHVIEPNGDFYFHVPNVASFFVSKGNSVLVSPAPNASKEELKMYLLGTIMAIILFQRKLIPFHCGCIKTPKGAVLIAADSGVGKSSLIASFYKKGYKILSDDLCAINISDNNTPLIIGSYPRLKLNSDVAGFLFPEKTKHLNLDELFHKYIFNIKDQFWGEQIKIYKIYELHLNDEFTIRSNSLNNKETIEMLYRNIFRYRFSNSFGSTAELFRNISSLANIQSVGIYRPNGNLKIDELAEFIEKDFT
jgi:hypothetical protein